MEGDSGQYAARIQRFLRNLRRELYREVHFGPRTPETLSDLSQIASSCAADLTTSSREVGERIAEQMTVPLSRLGSLRKHLASSSQSSFVHMLTTEWFETNILHPFSAALERYRYGLPQPAPTSWESELSTATATTQQFQISPPPSLEALLERPKPTQAFDDDLTLTKADRKALEAIFLNFFASVGAASLIEIFLICQLQRGPVESAIGHLIEEGLLSRHGRSVRITKKGVKAARVHSYFRIMLGLRDKPDLHFTKK